VKQLSLLLLLSLLCTCVRAQETRPPKNYADSLDFAKAPVRKTTDLPLSDQSNIGGWQLDKSLSEEFHGARIDEQKWYPNNPKWKGRAPTYFHGSNVSLEDEELVVRVNQHAEEVLPATFTHSTGFIKSKRRFRYGYIEAELKPMDAPWVSGFWLTNVGKDWWTEIDICENAPGVTWNRHDLNSNVHVFRAPADKGDVDAHFAISRKFYVPFELQQDYHVWGLEWTPEVIRFYLDGVLFREQENTHWHQALEININCESNKWFGALPDDSRLQGEMRAKYVRVWKSADTKVAASPPFHAEWANHPLPRLDNDERWELLEDHSDNFNYAGKTDAFHAKWKDAYFNRWKGPGLTKWQADHSEVANGKLILKASRMGEEEVATGIITSRTPIEYPVYTEARIKASNLELSTNFWLLSKDSKREIDVVEVYAGSKQAHLSRRATSNFHVFFRDAAGIHADFADSNPVMLPDSAFWRDDYHTFGVFWKSPTDVTFFVDGKETAGGSWREANMYDKRYTETYLDKDQYLMDRPLMMILDLEDHAWRSEAGHTPTDGELADDARNRVYVDWVRTYRLSRQR